MNIRRFVGDIFAAFAAQGVGFVVGSISSLVIPRFLGVDEYGYWQLFLFYASYMGVFSLGLNDGVYLRCGGIPRDRIDKRKYGTQFWCALIYEAVFSVAIVAGAIYAPLDEGRRAAVVAAALLIVPFNVSYYFGFMFQSMNETYRYSSSVAVNKLAFLALLLVLFAAGCDDFVVYIAAYIAAQLLSMLYCIARGADLVTAGFLGLRRGIAGCIETQKTGVPFMFASLVDMLILGVARFAIDASWDIATFGQVSLSLSIANFFLSFVTQGSMVFFPSLRQVGPDALRRAFRIMRSAIGLISPLAYILYFPMAAVLAIWLPQYRESFGYLSATLALCVFNSRMSIVGTTYLKVVSQERTMLFINLISFGMSLAGVALGVSVFHDVYVVLLSVVASMAWRSVYAERRVCAHLDIEGDATWVADVMVSVLFIAAVLFLPFWWACAAVSASVIAFWVHQRRRLADVVKECISVLKA